MQSIIQWRSSKISDLGITLIRVWLGFTMIRHSFPVLQENGFMEFGDWLGTMGIPLPHFMAYLSKGGEFVGGLMLVSGLLTRLGALIIVINMLVAVFVAQNGAILSDGALAFAYLIMAITIFLNGPDQWCADKLLFKKSD